MNLVYSIGTRLFLSVGIVLLGLAALAVPDRMAFADTAADCQAGCSSYQGNQSQYNICLMNCYNNGGAIPSNQCPGNPTCPSHVILKDCQYGPHPGECDNTMGPNPNCSCFRK